MKLTIKVDNFSVDFEQVNTGRRKPNDNTVPNPLDETNLDAVRGLI